MPRFMACNDLICFAVGLSCPWCCAHPRCACSCFIAVVRALCRQAGGQPRVVRRHCVAAGLGRCLPGKNPVRFSFSLSLDSLLCTLTREVRIDARALALWFAFVDVPLARTACLSFVAATISCLRLCVPCRLQRGGPRTAARVLAQARAQGAPAVGAQAVQGDARHRRRWVCPFPVLIVLTLCVCVFRPVRSVRVLGRFRRVQRQRPQPQQERRR